MSLKITLPDNLELKPKIVIFGLGGAGGNAVNNMIIENVEGVEFWVANTDAQALKHSIATNKIQLGVKSTRGLGAGSNPEVGKIAVQESAEMIKNALNDCHMLFITAGMGGGTGTGAAPEIAKIAKEMGVLVVAVVTKPFHFEGGRRMKIAELGLEELEKHVYTLIVIPNQNLFRVASDDTTFAEAFKKADGVLRSGVTSITDLIVMPGLINLDFADIRTVMNEMGKAMMGTGEADGEDRAIKAAEAAISNPILDIISMKGAKGVLINITGGSDMKLFEVDAAANRIKQEVDKDANIIFGSAFNENLNGKIRVSVVATGIDTDNNKKIPNVVAFPNDFKIDPLPENQHSVGELGINNNNNNNKDNKDKINTTGNIEENGNNYNYNELNNSNIKNKYDDKKDRESFKLTSEMVLNFEEFGMQKNNTNIIGAGVDDIEINKKDTLINKKLFNSNGFLANKGFFIPPKAGDPDNDNFENNAHADADNETDRDINTNANINTNIKYKNNPVDYEDIHNQNNKIKKLQKTNINDINNVGSTQVTVKDNNPANDRNENIIINDKATANSSATPSSPKSSGGLFSKMLSGFTRSAPVNDTDENIRMKKDKLEAPAFLRRKS